MFYSYSQQRELKYRLIEIQLPSELLDVFLQLLHLLQHVMQCFNSFHIYLQLVVPTNKLLNLLQIILFYVSVIFFYYYLYQARTLQLVQKSLFYLIDLQAFSVCYLISAHHLFKFDSSVNSSFSLAVNFSGSFTFTVI